MKRLLFILLLFSSLISLGQHNPIVGTNGLYLVGDTMYLISADRSDTARGFWYNNDFYWKFNNTDSTLFFSSDGSARKVNIGGGSGNLNWSDTLNQLATDYDVDQVQSALEDSCADIRADFPTGGGASNPIQHYFSSPTEANDSATAKNFRAGAFYYIPDPGAFTGSFIILQATTDSTLARTGQGKFINSVMSNAVDAEMDYDLTNDFTLKVTAYNSTSTGPNIATLGSVGSFPFDNIAASDNIFDNCSIDNLSFTTLTGNRFINAEINIQNGSDVNRVEVLQGSYLEGGTIAACNISDTKIESSAVVVATDNHTLTQCHIGAGKTIDLSAISSGYTATGKFYTAEGSNFEVTSANSSDVNPSANTIDMADFPWAGILNIDDGSSQLRTFSNYNTDHKIKINIAAGVTQSVNGAGNIKLSSLLSSPISLDGTNGDYFVVETNPSDVSQVRIIEINQY